MGASGNGSPPALKAGLATRNADQLLAEFVSAGDETAFGEVVRRHAGMVFATCLRVTRDAHDAEDATQATFLTLAVQCKTGKVVRKLTPWLQQVAKRAALDLHRSRARRQMHEHRHSAMTLRNNGHCDGDPAHPTAGDASALRGDGPDLEEVNRVLAEEVARLPAKYRLPLISLYFGGMSRQEVARETGCTPAALSVRVHRGRQMLARRLGARGVVLGAGKLLAGGVLAAGVGAALREALVARTVESVAYSALGRGFDSSVSTGVLSIVRAASFVTGAFLAKLKVPVALVLLTLAASASAAGGVGRLCDAVEQWSGELQLAPAARRVMQMLRSPFRAPQASAVGAGPRQGEVSDGPPPVGGAGEGSAGLRSPVPISPRFTALLPAPRPFTVPPAVGGGRSTFWPVIGTAVQPGALQTPRAGRRDAGGRTPYDRSGGILALVRPEIDTDAGTTHISVTSRGVLNLNDFGGPRTTVSGRTPGRRPHGTQAGPTPPSLEGSPVPAPGSAIVTRGDPAEAGQISGWGEAVGHGGVLVNNGQVIADGAGSDRSLVVLGYSSVTNTIDNPDAGGTRGWYARNGGRLVLPRIAASSGTATYTWGESASDPTIDLVNSVRLTLRDAQGEGTLDVALLDPHRADVPTLPRGQTVIGVWSLDTGATRPTGGVDLTVRYDDGLAGDLGLDEDALKLWQFEDGRWLPINDGSFSQDAAHNLVSGRANPGLTYFAVSAPEPAAAAMALAAVAAGMLRRRRA